MAEKINFELVTPEALMFSKDVEMVVIPGAQGDFGVLPEHAPLVSMLRPGLVTIYNGDTTEQLFVSSGYADTSSKQCTVLAEEALPFKDITREKVEARLANAEDALKKAKTDLEYKKAESNFEAAKVLEMLISAEKH